MSTWWSNLIEKFSELPAATWYVLGLMVVLGVVLIVMGVKRRLSRRLSPSARCCWPR